MKVHKDGWNVATSPRRDALTSQRWVNYYKSQQAASSQCLNVAKLQRRDVSASSASPSLKAKRGPEFEASRIIRTRAWKSEQ